MLYIKFMKAFAEAIAKDKIKLMEYDIFFIKNPIKNPEEVDGSVSTILKEMERGETACILKAEERGETACILKAVERAETVCILEYEKRTYNFFESKIKELCFITEAEVLAKAEAEKLDREAKYWDTFADFVRYGEIL